ncbi:MAG: hypothetical protein ABIO44_07365 [Saprospiraceae bacterium]
MPDQFKKFLQKHRSELDNHKLNHELFDQIMDRANASTSSKVFDKKDKSKSFFLQLVRIAAVGLILVVSYFIISQIKEKSSHELIVKNTNPQTPINTSQADLSSSNKIENNSTEPPIIKLSEIDSSQISSIELSIKSNKINTSKPYKVKNSKLVDSNLLIADKNFTPKLKESNHSLLNIINTTISDSVKEIATIEVPPTPHLVQEPSTNPSIPKTLIPITKSKTEMNDIAQSNPSNDHSKDQFLEQKLKKGFFSFLSKKSRKWSNNTLAIDPVSKDNSTTLAINFKNHNLEFSKSLKINTN